MAPIKLEVETPKELSKRGGPQALYKILECIPTKYAKESLDKIPPEFRKFEIIPIPCKLNSSKKETSQKQEEQIPISVPTLNDASAFCSAESKRTPYVNIQPYTKFPYKRRLSESRKQARLRQNRNDCYAKMMTPQKRTGVLIKPQGYNINPSSSHSLVVPRFSAKTKVPISTYDEDKAKHSSASYIDKDCHNQTDIDTDESYSENSDAESKPYDKRTYTHTAPIINKVIINDPPVLVSPKIYMPSSRPSSNVAQLSRKPFLHNCPKIIEPHRKVDSTFQNQQPMTKTVSQQNYGSLDQNNQGVHNASFNSHNNQLPNLNNQYSQNSSYYPSYENQNNFHSGNYYNAKPLYHNNAYNNQQQSVNHLSSTHSNYMSGTHADQIDSMQPNTSTHNSSANNYHQNHGLVQPKHYSQQHIPYINTSQTPNILPLQPNSYYSNHLPLNPNHPNQIPFIPAQHTFGGKIGPDIFPYTNTAYNTINAPIPMQNFRSLMPSNVLNPHLPHNTQTVPNFYMPQNVSLYPSFPYIQSSYYSPVESMYRNPNNTNPVIPAAAFGRHDYSASVPLVPNIFNVNGIPPTVNTTCNPSPFRRQTITLPTNTSQTSLKKLSSFSQSTSYPTQASPLIPAYNDKSYVFLKTHDSPVYLPIAKENNTFKIPTISVLPKNTIYKPTNSITNINSLNEDVPKKRKEEEDVKLLFLQKQLSNIREMLQNNNHEEKHVSQELQNEYMRAQFKNVHAAFQSCLKSLDASDPNVQIIENLLFILSKLFKSENIKENHDYTNYDELVFPEKVNSEVNHLNLIVEKTQQNMLQTADHLWLLECNLKNSLDRTIPQFIDTLSAGNFNDFNKVIEKLKDDFSRGVSKFKALRSDFAVIQNDLDTVKNSAWNPELNANKQCACRPRRKILQNDIIKLMDKLREAAQQARATEDRIIKLKLKNLNEEEQLVTEQTSKEKPKRYMYPSWIISTPESDNHVDVSSDTSATPIHSQNIETEHTFSSPISFKDKKKQDNGNLTSQEVERKIKTITKVLKDDLIKTELNLLKFQENLVKKRIRENQNKSHPYEAVVEISKGLDQIKTILTNIYTDFNPSNTIPDEDNSSQSLMVAINNLHNQAAQINLTDTESAMLRELTHQTTNLNTIIENIKLLKHSL